MDSSFSSNLRQPAVNLKVKMTQNKEGSLLIKYLT